MDHTKQRTFEPKRSTLLQFDLHHTWLALALCLLGGIIGRATLPLGSLSLGSLYVMPVHLAWLVALGVVARALATKLTNSEKHVWAFCSGLLASQIVPEMMRNGDAPDSQPFSIAWLASIVLFLVASACAALLASGSRNLTNPTTKLRYLCILVVVVTVVAFRVSHVAFLAMQIPNDDRSLRVNGVEIHHIASATVLLWPGLLAQQTLRRLQPLLSVACAVCVGGIADQYCYILCCDHIVDLDGFYSSLPSTIGALVVTFLVCAAIWASGNESRSARNEASRF